MLNIFYARESVDKEKFIFDRIRASAAQGSSQAVRPGSTVSHTLNPHPLNSHSLNPQPLNSHALNPRALIIVPDQYSFETENQALRYLNVEGLMNVEVLSMSRLGSRLLSELGGQKQTFIDKYGRHMILARVAREEKANLQVFRGLEDRNSFIEMVNNFISELKQYNCGIAELKTMASDAATDSYTQKKLMDLALLYERYEKEIEGKYTDSEDYIDLFLNKIQRSELVRDNQVWVYGFDSFAPKALSVIGQLAARAADVNVVLTWDRNCRDEELFTLTGIVMDNLEAMAAAVGVKCRRSRIPASAREHEVAGAAGTAETARTIEAAETAGATETAETAGTAGATPEVAETAGTAGATPEVAEAAGTARASGTGGTGAAGAVPAADVAGNAHAGSLPAKTIPETAAPETAAPEAAGNRKSAAIRHIERELYALPTVKSQGSAGIHLVSAAGFYNEAESAAAYILHLVREKGLKYRDIRIVCNDQETRGPIIERVFQEYGLELFSDSKRDILSSPVVQYILALLDTVLDGWRTEDLFRVLKSGFGPLSREEVTDLENYAIKYRIRRTMWKRPFVKGASEYGEEGLAQMEALRQKAVASVAELELLVKGETAMTVADFIYGLYRYLYEKVGLPQKILDFMVRQEELGRVDLADETAQIWGRVIGILDQMIEIMGTENFDGKIFLDIFRVGLSQVEIGMLPPTRDGLVMGTMQRTRMSGVKALVVIGANEGVLPQEKPSGGLFSPEEKELFREQGRELCKVDSVVLMEERLAIYRNLSRPEQYLWMSCALADGDGKVCKPSSVYLKIKEIFPNLREERDVLNQENPLPLVHSGVSGLRHLTEALQDLADSAAKQQAALTIQCSPAASTAPVPQVTSASPGSQATQVPQAASAVLVGGLPSAWKLALPWYERFQPAALRLIRDGMAFTNVQERLDRQAVRLLYFKDPEGAISISPSRLEKFSRCPFSHFVAYGLRPEERRIFEIAPREIGDIYHECLMTLTRTLTRDDLSVTHPLSPWMTITRQQCRALVEETARRQMENYKEGLFHQGKEEQYRSQRIFDICDKVCWTVVEQVRAGQIERNDFEVGFYRGGQIPPIEIKLGGRRGQVDHSDQGRGDGQAGRDGELKGEAAPGSAVPDSAAPDSAALDSAALDSAAPGSAAPGSAAPDSAVPDSAAPGSAAPDSAAPGSAALGSAASGSGAYDDEPDDGETVYIEGKIDRVDYLPGDRVKIIDYKTGNENFSIREAKAGYRLQLMLYLKAACETEKRPAGVFYFKISEPSLDATGKDWDQEELNKEIRKSFKLNGIMVDDPQVIESIAGDFSGYSDIVPLRASKDRISGTGKENLLSEEDFNALTDAVGQKVRELCSNLVDGAIDIHPMKTRERSACTFCQYRGICRFDTVFEGCSYEII